MPPTNSFRDLVVWRKSIALAKETYCVTKKLPKHETFGLSSQLQRSAVSISSNIAEGSKRGSKRDFLQFLRIANGSAAELETQLVILSEVYPSVDLSIVQGILIEVENVDDARSKHAMNY